ncbi:nucleoporin Nup43 [Sitophilus oryzae]|uniref:Nucleoporin Nup43 n=1 Tax=Sitophilus oryzae TaxID=7048 RepID=A0A6J2YGD2_SITOR|nr:nucleoporin Nup43 [Sitophilus oryzae]XP_030762488.1 nucleoporin Nup43 [Sitophilus oryzae]
MHSDSASINMSHNLHGTFVSEKINKIRWRPGGIQSLNLFVTGSIDNEKNTIKLWDFCENDEENDIYPFTISSYMYDGDVADIQFINQDYFACASSSGSVHLMNIAVQSSGDMLLNNYMEWDKIHYFNNGEASCCTALAIYENDLVSVGEDGRINVLTAQSKNVIRSIDDADSCSLGCVLFLKHNEILTSNLRGQMKIWDLRSQTNTPTKTFMLSGDQVTPTCLIFHPTQRHLVIAGDELGAITTWDLRQNTFPVNVLNAHEGSINEIHFHPDHPDQLFSCSSAGEIWHWSTKNKHQSFMGLEDSDVNVWLAPDNVKNKLEVFTLMPTLGKSINTLDLNKNKVICGCANEAIYLINGINL